MGDLLITDEGVEAAARAIDGEACICRKGRNQYGDWYLIERGCAACGDDEAKARAVL